MGIEPARQQWPPLARLGALLLALRLICISPGASGGAGGAAGNGNGGKDAKWPQERALLRPMWRNVDCPPD